MPPVKDLKHDRRTVGAAATMPEAPEEGAATMAEVAMDVAPVGAAATMPEAPEEGAATVLFTCHLGEGFFFFHVITDMCLAFLRDGK